MNEYRLTYTDLYDEVGRVLNGNRPDAGLKGYAEILNNSICYYAFLLKIKLDAKKFNVAKDEVPFSFALTRLKQFGYLHSTMPSGFINKCRYVERFLMTLID